MYNGHNYNYNWVMDMCEILDIKHERVQELIDNIDKEINDEMRLEIENMRNMNSKFYMKHQLKYLDNNQTDNNQKEYTTMNSINKITVYTKSDCIVCNSVKTYLTKENIPYEEEDIKEIMSPKILTELSMKGIFVMSAPLLQINENFYNSNKFSHQNVLNTDKLKEILNTNNMNIITNKEE